MREPHSRGPLARSFFSADVLHTLRLKIILGEIQAGEKLVELKIADEMSVSRGPVRNALMLLEKEGLVRFLSNGRSEAVGFTLTDLDNLYNTRAYVEMKALEEAFAQPSHDFNSIQAINRELHRELNNVYQFTSLDLQYHEQLMILSGNKYLLQAWQSLRPAMETILLITNAQIRLKGDSRPDKSYVLEHHDWITDALLRQDLQNAMSKLREHIDKGQTIMKEQLSLILLDSNTMTAEKVLEASGLVKR